MTFRVLIVGFACWVAICSPRTAVANDSQLGRTIFHSTFELGDLEDPTEEHLSALDFLRDWEQVTQQAGLQVFMLGSVSRGAPVIAGAETANHRYLRLPLDGGRALLRSRAPIGVTPGAVLRVSLLARWDALATGHWSLDLVALDGRRWNLLRGTGERSQWGRLDGRTTIPEGAHAGHLEITLESVPASIGGSIGFDEILVRIEPRFIWGFAGMLHDREGTGSRRVSVHAVALDPGVYEAELRVRDPRGKIRLEERRTRLVRDHPTVDLFPRLAWSERALPRGIYTVELTVTSRDDGRALSAVRPVALVGAPPFPRRHSALRWGVEVSPEEDSGTEDPRWLAIVRPSRALVVIDDPERAAVPSWLEHRRDVQRGVILEPSGWREASPDALAPLLSHVRQCYWRAAANTDGALFLGELRKVAPHLETGFAPQPDAATGAPMETLVSVSAPSIASLRARRETRTQWSARIDLTAAPEVEQPRRLALALYLLAAQDPRAIHVASPGALFFDAEDGVPTRALLVWEFVTAFLSGADFTGRESWAADVECLTFARDGEEFLVIVTDGEPRELTFMGAGPCFAYDSAGARTPLEAAPDGRVTFLATHEPLLVRGLDIDRMRTTASLRAAVENIDPGGRDQKIVISLKNHFGRPVRAALRLRAPERWEMNDVLDPRRIEANAVEEWSLRVRVPPAHGITGPTALEGTLVLQRDDAPDDIELPVSLAVSVESALIEIRPVGIGETDADIVLRNRSRKPITFRVYLGVSPGGVESTFYDQTLAPNAEKKYQLRYPRSSADRSLWVGVMIESPESYVNRAYDIPAVRSP